MSLMCDALPAEMHLTVHAVEGDSIRGMLSTKSLNRENFLNIIFAVTDPTGMVN